MSQAHPVMRSNDLPSPDESPPLPAHSAALLIREALRSECLYGQERAAYLANHPLNQRPVRILTNSIKIAYLCILEDIKFKRPGSAFAADFRIGKSTALLMIKQKLIDQMPEVGFGLISAKEAITARVFWGDVLIAFGLDISGTGQDRQNRVRNAIITACIEAGGKHFCLLIDEAQNWSETEYTLLRDLTNQLREQDGYSVTTVAWGDMRLEEISAKFRGTRKDLWARFLMSLKKFYGIRDLADLRFFLAEYDNPRRCEYPSGSGLTYSEFFLPMAFSKGWRLEREAAHLWDALDRAATKVNRKIGETGMQWVGEAVTRFLTLKMTDDSSVLSSVPKDWDVAVEHSGYTSSLV